jgi:hypothetical protein
MVLDEIAYINDFPHSFSLSGGEAIDLDIIGPVNLSIQDSLLIVTTLESMGMWKFFSLPEYNNKGKYLNKGRGPNDFLSMPLAEQQYFYKENEQLFSIIYDFSNGKLFRMNINETILSNKLSMSEIDYLLPKTMFGYTFINSTDILCREVNNTHTQQKRYLLSKREREDISVLEKMNIASIRPGEDINILSVHTVCSQNGERIAEAALGLNQINLYSLDGSFGKTICVGKKVDNISRVLSIGHNDRLYTYMDIVAFSDFFGALYLNDTEANFQQETTCNPVIQFFDWDGNPLAEVELDRMITSYDIDFFNGALYTLYHNTEEIYKYDISHLLQYLYN